MALFSLRRPRDRGTRHPRARAQRLEMLVGILGFFAAMAAIQAVVLEVRGESAVVAALILLGLVVALGWALKARRNVPL